MSILDVADLRVVYGTQRSGARRKAPESVAVDDVSFSVDEGEIFGIVGESGSGKTTVAQCISRFVTPTAGSILFRGEEIAGRRSSRHDRRAQLIFQDPYSSLNPSMTIRQALSEPLRVHGLRPANRIGARTEELLELVGLNPSLLDSRPKRLSGGQRQRASIARALALEPELLIADEPVSALDVSVQATVLNLLARLRSQLGMSMVFISHDLAVVSYLCDRIGVMSGGRMVETGPTAEILTTPSDPYTQRLLSAVPPHPWVPGSAEGPEDIEES